MNWCIRRWQRATALALAGILATVLLPFAALASPQADPGNDVLIAPEGDATADSEAASDDGESALGPQRLCPIDYISVPESSTGVVSEWLSYGQSLSVVPQGDTIWAGVWFTGRNGPEGWTNTRAPSSYPLPGAREYSLIARIGNESFRYVGSSSTTFTNNKPGYIQRVLFRVNDNNPGNGNGAFRVFVAYPCYYKY